MALQDLTPQLRTRLSRMERVVGWFVFLATALLLFGLGYYIYVKAQSKGWFLVRARYYTYVNSAAGVAVGDPVSLMGFRVGDITGITAMPPRTGHNVRIEFVINQVNQLGEPYFGYIWTEGSVVKLNSAGFLNQRSLEVTRGTSGFNIYQTHPLKTLTLDEARSLADPEKWRLAQNLYDEHSNFVFRAFTPLVESNVTRIAEITRGPILAFDLPENDRHITCVWDNGEQRYVKYNYRNENETNAYELSCLESPAISDQLQAMVSQVQQALPNFLALTNQLFAVLKNTANATSNLNVTLAGAQPVVTNFALISAQLREPGGPALWALGTNGNAQVQGSLTNLNSLLGHADTNLNSLLAHTDTNLTALLINLADITSNLNAQVQANSNMLSGIAKTVSDTDDFVQGLKHFWLLRSTFKKENAAEKKKEEQEKKH